MIPECDKTTTGVVRTWTILIAAGPNKPQIFRCLEDVPGPLRRLLTKCTESGNSGKIWIADRRGRERIGRALPGKAPEDSGKRRTPSIALVWLWGVAVLAVGACFALVRSRL